MVNYLYRNHESKGKIDFRLDETKRMEVAMTQETPDHTLRLDSKESPAGRTVLFRRLQNRHTSYGKRCQKHNR
ncbi:hypothetical protein [Spirosoma pollinicola]|uniref:hypothetical protein n=1 Tax=Spirosoma pollinicola TaxID=2057025 RepID=UPI0012FE1EE7|nr:hypothetical protein [Spirosoma pollinicola]